MVDHWGQTPEQADADPVGHPFYREMLEETAFAGDRRVILRRASPAAAALVPDDLDFVFIDGDHLYEPCLADLEAWWPKVRSGGWLFGHDIDNPAPKYADWGVRQAVEEFAGRLGLPFDVYPFPEMVFAIRKP
jgi:predicted O-methyltransferase YrrM